MRLQVLDLLCCPECAKPGLELTVFREEAGEVRAGMLTCLLCKCCYPIIDGVPRLLPKTLWPELVTYHGEFLTRYPCFDLDADHVSYDGCGRSATRRTLASFSFQWRTFRTMHDIYERDFQDYIQPLTSSSFEGRLVLDAGCGFGRHAYWASRYGARVVALDLSEAVESAYLNTRVVDGVEVVQGDICRPPLRRDAFDLVYSIGVLHHLPDPPTGFRSLVRLVRPGGRMFGWVYGHRRGPSELLTRMLRRLTTRMNYRVLCALCLAIAGSLRLFSHAPSSALDIIAPLRGFARRFPFSDYRYYPFRALVGDIFDRLSVPLVHYYSRAEFESWFEDAGLIDIQVLRRYRHNVSWRGLGVRPG